MIGFNRPVAGALLLALGPSMAAAQTSDGYRVVQTPHAFAVLEERLKAAVTKHQMSVVSRASASDGARARGITIPGDAVYGIFRNDFAIRMLEANVEAGIEAPIRVHLTQAKDGTSSIRYYRPSTVFGRYDGEAIKALGRDLDPIFDAIVRDASAPQ